MQQKLPPDFLPDSPARILQDMENLLQTLRYGMDKPALLRLGTLLEELCALYGTQEVKNPDLDSTLVRAEEKQFLFSGKF
ncbi:hypothetical protein FACS1894206_05710 [Deltaproteobacteria bacterium]|nr:hypothetical protein FACS1894206_05710 [Deltaproteobacteria bacterium]